MKMVARLLPMALSFYPTRGIVSSESQFLWCHHPLSNAEGGWSQQSAHTSLG